MYSNVGSNDQLINKNVVNGLVKLTPMSDAHRKDP